MVHQNISLINTLELADLHAKKCIEQCQQQFILKTLNESNTDQSFYIRQLRRFLYNCNEPLLIDNLDILFELVENYLLHDIDFKLNYSAEAKLKICNMLVSRINICFNEVSLPSNQEFELYFAEHILLKCFELALQQLYNINGSRTNIYKFAAKRLRLGVNQSLLNYLSNLNAKRSLKDFRVNSLKLIHRVKPTVLNEASLSTIAKTFKLKPKIVMQIIKDKLYISSEKSMIQELCFYSGISVVNFKNNRFSYTTEVHLKTSYENILINAATRIISHYINSKIEKYNQELENYKNFFAEQVRELPSHKLYKIYFNTSHYLHQHLKQAIYQVLKVKDVDELHLTHHIILSSGAESDFFEALSEVSCKPGLTEIVRERFTKLATKKIERNLNYCNFISDNELELITGTIISEEVYGLQVILNNLFNEDILIDNRVGSLNRSSILKQLYDFCSNQNLDYKQLCNRLKQHGSNFNTQIYEMMGKNLYEVFLSELKLNFQNQASEVINNLHTTLKLASAKFNRELSNFV